MEPVFILFVIGGIALVVLVAFLGHLAAKKRREAMQRLAEHLGWSFYPDKDSSHDDEYAHFEIFRKGHSRVAFNTMVGDVEIDGRRFPAKAGDFRYRVTSGSGKNRSTRTYTFTYLILHLPFTSTPDLLIRREGLFDKLAGAFGFDDIDFESEAVLAASSTSRATDKRFAYDLMPRADDGTPARRRDLPTLDIEARPDAASSMAAPDGKPPRRSSGPWIGFLHAFLELWPEHVSPRTSSRAG